PDRRSPGGRRNPPHPQPALRRRRLTAALARRPAHLPRPTRTSRLPDANVRTSALVLLALVAGLITGCGGSKHAATSTGSTPPTVSTRQDTASTLDRAVRVALNENFRLSLYVLWHNSIPPWAQHSTRGPALAALRSAAATRRGRGLRIRSQPGHYTIQ